MTKPDDETVERHEAACTRPSQAAWATRDAEGGSRGAALPPAPESTSRLPSGSFSRPRACSTVTGGPFSFYGAPVDPVLDGLRAYRNPDGGFGHALEPDIRAPTSEPSATMHALAVLAEVGALDEPMVGDAADWVATVAGPAALLDLCPETPESA